MSEASWPDVSFSGFNDGLLRRNFWEDAVRKVIELQEKGERVGVVADTGAGKTIIALLDVLYACGKRTLFLAPTRILTSQHSALLERMQEGVKTRIINGEVPLHDRVWDDKDDIVVFATPHVVLSELSRNTDLLENFRFIVVDEFHKATGKYPYVPIAKLSVEKGIVILALSACPGTDVEMVGSVMNNCGVTKLLRVDWPDAPKRLEDKVSAPLDKRMIKIDSLFNNLLVSTADRLKAYSKKWLDYDLPHQSGAVPNRGDIEALQEEVKKHQAHTPRGVYFTFVSLITQYRKLRHGYNVLLTESYETFDEYVIECVEKVNTVSARFIRDNSTFKQIMTLVRNRDTEHPKVTMLITVLESMKRMSWRGIIFVGIKKTGLSLHEKLTKRGLSVEILFGGKDKNLKRQTETLEKLKRGDIDFIISTSVIEEGVSVPEVKAVLHYSVPSQAISRIQRSGRTARMEVGHVVYVSIDHKLDNALYWASHRGVAKAKAITKELTNKALSEIKVPKVAQTKTRRGSWKENKSQLKFDFVFGMCQHENKQLPF